MLVAEYRFVQELTVNTLCLYTNDTMCMVKLLWNPPRMHSCMLSTVSSSVANEYSNNISVHKLIKADYEFMFEIMTTIFEFSHKLIKATNY